MSLIRNIRFTQVVPPGFRCVRVTQEIEQAMSKHGYPLQTSHYVMPAQRHRSEPVGTANTYAA